MFNIYLRKINIPSHTIDSRNSGYGMTVSGTSTPSEIIFSSGITGQTETWIGGIIIFTSGTYANMGAEIGGENKTGTTLNSVLLSQEFPTAPSAGTTFILYKRGDGTIQYQDYVYQISKHVESVKFDTVIDGGYDIAQVNLNGNITRTLNQYSDILGMDIVIEDIRGHKCFNGIVANINLGANGGTIDCVGYNRTFGWFEYSTVYGATSDITSTKILRDITSANPYMLNNRAIDRDESWDAAQQVIGGIGPINFSESIITGQDAINRILEMGRLGISVEAVYMVLYNEPEPELRYTSATITEPTYVLNRNNYAYSQSGFNVKGSLSDTYALVSAPYTDVNNQTFYTPYAVNYRLLQRLGRRKKTVTSTGNSGVYESTAIVQQSNNDYQNLISSDQYTVSGFVWKNGMNTKVPVYYIKAGDSIKVETPYGYETVYQNATMNAIEFYVGKTSYDSSTGVMTIIPVNDPKKAEIYAARLKV